MAPSQEELADAVNALYRIRAVENPPGEDGLRSVWHQNAKGADLVSWVDEKGHVVRQELTLLEDHFQWTSRHGLITGETGEVSGHGMKPSADLRLDPAIVPARVIRAADALASYKGQDRYIRNMQRVLGMVRTGLQSYEEVTVTRSVGGPLPGPAAAKPPGRPRALVALGFAVLLLGAVVGIALFISGS